MTKYILPTLVLLAATFSAPAFAQAQTTAQGQTQNQGAASGEDDEDYDDIDYALEIVDATLIINEECKGALDPDTYDHVKATMRLVLGVLGATDDQAQQFEAESIKAADIICQNKSACWQMAAKLPETATLAEGKAACLSMLGVASRELQDILDPQEGT